MVPKRTGPNRPRFTFDGDLSLSSAADLLTELNDPYCERASKLVRDGKHMQYLGLDFPIGPGAAVCDTTELKKRYLAYMLLRKCPSLDLGIDRVEVAMARFWEAEEQCRLTNERLSKSLASYKLFSGYTCESILYVARKKIARLLGSFKSDECSDVMDFGPGATFHSKRRYADARYKFRGPLETTAENLATCHEEFVVRRLWWQFGEIEFRIAPGCRVTTVPKDARTDRTIAIEPSMNMFVQKGIGRMLRRRLKRVGVDLDDQSLNQKAARKGSIDGSLATLDLSAASDTVSQEIVSQLLPPDWLDALERARSSVCVLPNGTWHRFHKFSTMGNGYTFELESLIFWALCSSCCDLLGLSGQSINVYGDDLVVPALSVKLIEHVLPIFGFTLNIEKSFSSGHFRESCGKHYLHGIDITPFQIKRPMSDVSRLFWFCNRIREWSTQDRSYDGCYTWRTYSSTVQRIPRELRFRIPAGYGDVGLVESFDAARPQSFTGPAPRRCRQIQGFRFKGVSEVTRRVKSHDWYQYIVWHHRRSLSGREPVEVYEVVQPRKIEFRVSNYSVSSWPSDDFWLGRF